MVLPFRPVAQTARLAVTTANKTIPIPGAPLQSVMQVRLRVKAGSAAPVHVRAYRSSQIPTPVASVPVADGAPGSKGIDPGGVEIFTVEPGVDTIAAIGDGGAATLDVTLGEGD